MQNSQTNTFLKGMNLDTAKEFVGTEQYIDALDVHVNTDAGATAGALQPYLDVVVDNNDNGLTNHTILGTTAGHFGKDKANCFIVLSHYSEDEEDGGKTDMNALSVFDIKDNTLLWKLETPDLQCKTRVKLVNLWEDEERSRVYISSEDSYIQIVNINSNYGTVSGVVNNVTGYDFSMFPRCGALMPLKFSHIVAGNKTAGKVQYAYQLFDKSGETTALSAISHMIPIGSDLSNDFTNEGVVIKCEDVPQSYSYVRIYEIRYTNSTDVPRVFIKDEFQIQDQLIYTDTSDSHLSEITLEQFHAIKSFQFQASSIEIKDNRLFAANIRQCEFDIEFDARVYSANSEGIVEYTTTSGVSSQINIDNICQQNIPNDEVVNNQDPNKYKYGAKFANGKRVLGGRGPNIQYEFICPILIAESNSDFNRPTYGSDTLNPNYGFKSLEMLLPSTDTGDANNVQYESITILSGFYDNSNIGDNFEKYQHSSVETANIQSNQHVVNALSYADTYISSNYVGFKQGECYTFGIVFYNEANIPSPVHYVGTIHIPYLNNTYSTYKDEHGKVHDLAVMPVGIRFHVNTTNLLKQGVVAYEIVREQKTIDNRKIMCQGILSNTYPAGKHAFSTGDSDLRLPIFPTIGLKMKTVDNYQNQDINFVDNYYEHTLNSEYVSITSPEISVNKENFKQSLQLLDSMKLVKVLYSFMVDNEDLYKKVYTNIHGGHQFDRNGAYPIARHFTYATAPSSQYTVNGNTYKHYKVFGTTIFMDNEYVKDVAGIPLKNAHDSMAYGLFKYYVTTNILTDYVLKDAHGVLCATLPVDHVGATSNNFNVVLDQKSIVNMSFALGKENSYETFGGHGNCVIASSADNSYLDAYEKVIQYTPIRLGSNVYDTTNHGDWSYASTLTIQDVVENDHINRPSWVYNYGDFINQRLVNYDNSVNVPGVFVVDMLTGYSQNMSHSQLSSINYTSFGNYFKISDSECQQNDVFGGDTYVCVHKELWSGYGYDESYTLGKVKARASVNIKYPVETRINLDRVSGPNYDSVVDSEKLGLMFEPGVNLLGSAQELPLNEYNDAYSAQEYNKVFVSKGVWDLTNQHLSNRILASEVKSLGELTDSFQDFKIANYIDVDGQYGPITNLVKYNGRLYYLQSTAFGTVSINERSLITDNNQATLLLGTGDVLQRYDYISTFNGSNKLNDPSIVVSPSSLYWYDSNKQSIQVFNQGGLNSLSKLKNVQSYFDNIVRDKTVHSGYDMKYNEVWFSAEDSGRDSIIYSEQIQAFVGFYSKQLRYPKTGERFALGLTPDNKFIHFGECDGHVNPEQSLRHVEFVVNQNAGMPKVFDTFAVNDCVRPMKDETQWFVAKFSTNRQGDASLTPPVNKEGVYYMSIGRDGNKERMRDKIMTVKLTLNTTEFSIPSVSTMFRYSRI